MARKGRGSVRPKTLNAAYHLQIFFRWLHQKGVLLIDPAEKIPQRSVLSPLPEVLSQQEAQAVLEAADAHRRLARPDARLYTLAALLLATGIKKGECLSLSPNHVDLENTGGPLLFIRYVSPQHRYKERKIEIPSVGRGIYGNKSQYNPLDRLFPGLHAAWNTC
jgi:integrase/recombinase XerD